VFFVDGVDVLFRIAMAILRNNEAELLRCESIPAVYVSLENLPTRMWEADKLLQVCDGLYFSDCVIVLEPFFSCVCVARGGTSELAHSLANYC
jgi:hypothetical protein